MTFKYELLETYENLGALAVGLHNHRLELANTTSIANELTPMLQDQILYEPPAQGTHALLILASNQLRVELRQAILAFVQSKSDLQYLLKTDYKLSPSGSSVGSHNPGSGVGSSKSISSNHCPSCRRVIQCPSCEKTARPEQQCEAIGRPSRLPAGPENAFESYFPSGDSFREAITDCMTSLIESPQLSSLLTNAQRTLFCHNDILASDSFTQWMSTQRNPELLQAVRDWIDGHPEASALLEPVDVNVESTSTSELFGSSTSSLDNPFYRRFKDASLFADMMCSHMQDLVFSPELQYVLTTSQRLKFSKNEIKTSRLFTLLMFSPRNPTLLEAVWSWFQLEKRTNLRDRLCKAPDDFTTASGSSGHPSRKRRRTED